MKFKVIANQTLMTPDTGCSAQKALTVVCGILQGYQPGEQLDVKVYYLNHALEWKLETYFKIGKDKSL